MPKSSKKGQRQCEERSGETQTWQKGNRNSRTEEGRNRNVGCSIIHSLIKHAQAPGLSTGFWPLYRRNSSAPVLAPVADPVSGSWGGWQWRWGADGRGPPDPCKCPFACPSCDLSLYFSYLFMTFFTSIPIQTAHPTVQSGQDIVVYKSRAGILISLKI